MYADFDLVIPETLDGALEALAEANGAGGTQPLAGGTNMIVDLRRGAGRRPGWWAWADSRPCAASGSRTAGCAWARAPP